MTHELTQRSVIFSGGGSGGHLFPGIAVARELLAREPNTRVLFVGSQKPIEKKIVGEAGFEHVELPSVSPSLSPNRIVSSAFHNWQAYRQAREIITRERPNIVVGLGGFASFPPVLVAWRAGVPIVLLEQNVVPGKATRWLSRFAKAVCLPWPQAARGLPHGVRTVVTGNPIRAEIAALFDESNKYELPASDCESHPLLQGQVRSEETNPQANAGVPRPTSNHRFSLEKGSSTTPTLLIVGGSQGATSLNAVVLDALATLRTELAGWRIVHQTGAADLNSIRVRYAALSCDAAVHPFIVDMAATYRDSMIAISRAGATTLSEIACAGLPSILVPLPNSAHDHQRLNARLFAEHSAALVVEQSAPVGNSLQTALGQLLSDGTQRNQIRQNLRALARPNAASAVVDVIEQYGTFRLPQND